MLKIIVSYDFIRRALMGSLFLFALLLIFPFTLNADEAVEQSYALVKSQVKNIHQKTLRVSGQLREAWDDFREDPTPANEARINKLKGDFETLHMRSKDLWNWVHELGDERSMALNTIRQIIGQAEATFDAGAELARGVIPGATWILGASEKTLFNKRWEDTEAQFSALLQKGGELRSRYKAILADIENKVSDTPENREELKKLEDEIEIWKSKVKVMSEIYEFLRSDMPAEVVFWNELTGPYVEAITDNIKNNLEEMILWDTLGGTSPIERIYKLFKPLFQMKFGEYFSDPILTDKVRNIIVMEVLFANAPLDRMLKTAETGIGKVLDSGPVQKMAAEFMGNRARRQELLGMLKGMSYDQIPGKSSPARGALARFTASGLKGDEIKRLQRVKKSQEVANGIMKVANELIGPLLQSGAFRTALENAKVECKQYRVIYKKLREADIIGRGTYMGTKGQAATTPDDNFVNECFDNPTICIEFLKRLEEGNPEVDITLYNVKKTFRKKDIELENVEAEDEDPEESDSYKAYGRKVKKIFDDLMANKMPAHKVDSEVLKLVKAMDELRSERSKEIYASICPGGCENNEREAALNRAQAAENRKYWPQRSTFSKLYHTPEIKEILAEPNTAFNAIKEHDSFLYHFLTRGPDKRLILETSANYGNRLFAADPPLTNFYKMWSAFDHYMGVVSSLTGEPSLPLKNGGPAVQAWSNQVDTAIMRLREYKKAKETEKDAILELAPDLEKLAEILFEHRNLFRYADSRYSGGRYKFGGSRMFGIDGAIAAYTDYEAQFLWRFNSNFAKVEELLERIEEKSDLLNRFAPVYSRISNQFWPKFEEYTRLFQDMDTGWREAQEISIDFSIAPLFSKGVDFEGMASTWLTLLMDELASGNLTMKQCDMIIDRGHELFILLPGLPQITHPVLRTFVTPSVKRLDDAFKILSASSMEHYGLISRYQQKEDLLADLEKDLSWMHAELYAAGRFIAPRAVARFSMDQLRFEYNSIFMGRNVPTKVEDYKEFPVKLFNEIRIQKQMLSKYHQLVDEVIAGEVLPIEVMSAIKELDDIERLLESGKRWAGMADLERRRAIALLANEAFEIYRPVKDAGWVKPGGDLETVYERVRIAFGKLNAKTEAHDEAAKVLVLLQREIKAAEGILQTVMPAQGSIDKAHTRLLYLLRPEGGVEEYAYDVRVGELIGKARELMSQLIKRRAEMEMLQSLKMREVISAFYDKFKQAYEQRDEYGVVSHLGDDWEAGDGTTIADLEMNLSQTFRMFDDISYKLGSLKIERQPVGGYLVSYDVTITSRIFSRNIKHVEKSSVSELVEVKDGKAKITRTLNGRFWYVE